MTRQTFVAWLMCASGVALAGTHVLVATQENSQIPPAARNYWAFKLPVQSAVPETATRFDNPIDRFLEKARRDKGLEPAPRASRLTLLRRAYLDLIGLPPTPAETAAFLADDSPDAWERLIDTLLASPHYGERWGRHWLDVARYADSSGFEQDYDRPNAWRYRDYVIRAFNQDKPYDQFLKEQIAGDELDTQERRHPDRDRLPARRAARRVPREGQPGTPLRVPRRHDRDHRPRRARPHRPVRALPQSQVRSDPAEGLLRLAGLVLRLRRDRCIRWCRTPKAAAYEKKIARDRRAARPPAGAGQTDRGAVPDSGCAQEAYKKFPEKSSRPSPSRSASGRRANSCSPAGDRADRSRRVAHSTAIMTPADAGAERRRSTDQIAALDKQRPAPMPVAEIVTDGDYRFAPNGDGRRGDRLSEMPNHRGPAGQLPAYRTRTLSGAAVVFPDPRRSRTAKGSEMKPGFVAVGDLRQSADRDSARRRPHSGRRRALAEWLASPQNPLTARVIVNRIWHHHFGRGIVATLDNFGKMGDAPTHPELLDWLAVEFMNRGWSIKQMHRLIMTSDAYQMASRVRTTRRIATRIRRINTCGASARSGSTPKSCATASWPRAAASTSTSAVRRSFRRPKELLTEANHGIWKTQPDGPDVWRRSVYVYRKRGLAFPMFAGLRSARAERHVRGAAHVSTVPTQALTLLNDAFVLRQADSLPIA